MILRRLETTYRGAKYNVTVHFNEKWMQDAIERALQNPSPGGARPEKMPVFVVSKRRS